jgi:hypothetical protein
MCLLASTSSRNASPPPTLPFPALAWSGKVTGRTPFFPRIAAHDSMLPLPSTSSTAAPTAAERPDAPARQDASAAEAGGTRTWPGVVVHTGVAGVVDGVSTVAVASGTSGSTLASVPAALCRMSDIAVASSSGTLNDVDRAKLRSEYGQLSQQVASLIGSSVPNVVPESAASGDAPARQHGEAQHDDSQAGARARPEAVPDAASDAAKGAAGVVDAGPTVGMPAAVQHSELTRPAALAQFRRQQSAAPRTALSVRA